jgi:hypothetical protein
LPVRTNYFHLDLTQPLTQAEKSHRNGKHFFRAISQKASLMFKGQFNCCAKKYSVLMWIDRNHLEDNTSYYGKISHTSQQLNKFWISDTTCKNIFKKFQ